ncbi:hypothetical protein BKA93DRAFT_330242 [Sparassis latifolia]|uniref:Uncharacterized protein n=1 Tax=Sparassis crispa TaxID=139825 RepID=A0A401GU77_9APHY|nr:hypothetical protein SCP_0803030 [Sparassis crispa]GBE85781.1 hypothetical protein SCP_0803030 [Sparassis crispa]
MSSLAIVLLALVSATQCLPFIHPRQTTPAWCEGLGPGAFDTATNFTLTAYNITDTTLPPFTQIGLPLVVATTQLGPLDTGILATYVSYPYNDFPSFGLTSGALLPNYYADWYTTDVGGELGNDIPTFQWSPESDELDPPAQIYCAIANIDPAGGGNPYPQLAINTDANNFYLCINEEGWTEVVHSPSSNSTSYYPSYNLDSCYPVTIHLLGLD